jgi:hypothetical protein
MGQAAAQASVAAHAETLAAGAQPVRVCESAADAPLAREFTAMLESATKSPGTARRVECVQPQAFRLFEVATLEVE